MEHFMYFGCILTAAILMVLANFIVSKIKKYNESGDFANASLVVLAGTAAIDAAICIAIAIFKSPLDGSTNYVFILAILVALLVGLIIFFKKKISIKRWLVLHYVTTAAFYIILISAAWHLFVV